MTWKEFINPIKESELVSDNIPRILIMLFDAAGCNDGVSESAAKSWLNGSRNCKPTSWFHEGKLNNEQELFNFFRRRPDSKLKNLQEIYHSYVKADSVIDIGTSNLDVFCWSLVNQFLDLLGFQRIDIPTDTSLLSCDTSPVFIPIHRKQKAEPSSKSNAESIQSTNGPINISTQSEDRYKGRNNLLSIFYKGFLDYPIKEFIATEPSDLSPDRIRDAIVFCGYIEHATENCREENDNVRQRILEFASVFHDYIIFLKKHARYANVFPEHFQLTNLHDAIFEKDSVIFRGQLSSLAKTINEMAEKEVEENLRVQQSKHKEIGLEKFLL